LKDIFRGHIQITNLFIKLFVLFFTAGLVFSEDYFVKQTYKGPVLYQHLQWQSTGVVKEYQVNIEQLIHDEYKLKESIKTTDTYVDISYSSGKYRFNVYFYNVLGQKAFVTEYNYFEIVKATKPKISFIYPPIIFLGTESQEININAKVKNITSTADFSLVPVTQAQDNKQIKQKAVEHNQRSSCLTFDTKELTQGIYQIKVINNGGLSSSSAPVIVTSLNKPLIHINAGYSLQSVTTEDFIKTSFNTSIIPLSMYFDMTVLSKERPWGSAGISFERNISALSNTTSSYKTGTGIYSFCVNGAYQKSITALKEKNSNLNIFFGAYTGFGYNYFFNSYVKNLDNQQVKKTASLLPCFNIGTDVKLYIKENIFAQTGIQYLTTIKAGNADYTFATVKPKLGIGVSL